MGNLHRLSAGTVERIHGEHNVSGQPRGGGRRKRECVCADGNPCSVPNVLLCGAFAGNKALKIRAEALSPAVQAAGGVECNFCAGRLGEYDPDHTTTGR